MGSRLTEKGREQPIRPTTTMSGHIAPLQAGIGHLQTFGA
jgi:hypothetical protein